MRTSSLGARDSPLQATVELPMMLANKLSCVMPLQTAYTSTLHA